MDFETAVSEFAKPLEARETVVETGGLGDLSGRGPVGSGGRGQAIHFCNAYSVALAETDARFRALLSKATVVCCDGVPITWAGRFLYREEGLTWDRVYGPDVMTAVLSQGQAAGAKHYLLGGSESTLESLVSSIGDRWQGVVVVGAESPPFRDLSTGEQIQQVERIRASEATHVWVGLGQPKQDYAVAFLASQVGAKFFAVGAAFDFLAGIKPQAPRLIQKIGTEWLYRFATEPSRLSQRYLLGNPVFLYSCFKHGRKSLARN